MKKGESHLSRLHESVRQAARDLGIETLTPPQEEALPLVLEGRHVLILAPTASGKTEAALLPLLHNVRDEAGGGILGLYVTPLRALNRDMLERLERWGRRMDMSVDVRHGDTPREKRRRQAESPPQLLVTTPETLQAILPGTKMSRHLASVRWVVVDELHSLADSRRGVQLALALERLGHLTDGDFQRIGLSATVGSPEAVASLLGGTHREVEVVEASAEKEYRYTVERPTPVPEDYETADSLYTTPSVVARLKALQDHLEGAESTLVFVNSRTMAEMLGSRLSRLTEGVEVHHGSLSREERNEVETALKRGETRGVICTPTLELGIDVGSIDRVVQYLSPRVVTSLVQRVGRSGHTLERPSEGWVITGHTEDLLESLVTVELAEEGWLEETKVHSSSLDVLAHQMAGVLLDRGETTLSQLTEDFSRASPYADLEEGEVEEVASYLHELGLISKDGGRVWRRSRTWSYYYENLSTIPDEKLYAVRDVTTDRKVGVLGDEFIVTEARRGLNFLCSGRAWEIERIGEDEVDVLPREDPTAAVPGWDGELLPVTETVAARVGRLRRELGETLREKGVEAAGEELRRRCIVSKEEARRLLNALVYYQKRGLSMPSELQLTLEFLGRYLVVHTSRGDLVNRVLARSWVHLLKEHMPVEDAWNDSYRVLIQLGRDVDREEAHRIRDLLFDQEIDVGKVHDSAVKEEFPFPYEMKHVAERFGALPRGRYASIDLERIEVRFQGTPVYTEALREGMNHECDVDGAVQLYESVRGGEVQVEVVVTDEATPLAMPIIDRFATAPELVAQETAAEDAGERLENAVSRRVANLYCMDCFEWSGRRRVRELGGRPSCPECGGELLATLSKLARGTKSVLDKYREGGELSERERKSLSAARRTADLCALYGRKAVFALMVKGVGPQAASRILSRLHVDDEEFHRDLLEAKLQYLRTKEYWD